MEVYFSSPQELYEKVESLGGPDTKNGSSFVGATTAQCRERMFGWPEGIPALESLPRPNVESQSTTEKQWRDDDGDSLDYERMMDGLPPLRKRIRKFGCGKRGKVVEMYVNLTESCFVEAENILWKTYAVGKIVDEMESQGYRVEIHLVYYTVSAVYGQPLWIDIIFKKAEEPLNISFLLNCLSPWFYRGWLFGFIRPIPGIAGGFGHPRSLAEGLKAMGREQKEEWIVIERDSCLSAAQAERTVNSIKL